MIIIRRVGALLLAGAALAVFLFMAPEEAESSDLAGERAAIKSADDTNNDLADGAPQQTVVNGWTTVEYLDLISIQMDEAAPARGDERPAALLALGVVGIALIAFTAEPDRHRASRREELN